MRLAKFQFRYFIAAVGLSTGEQALSGHSSIVRFRQQLVIWVASFMAIPFRNMSGLTQKLSLPIWATQPELYKNSFLNAIHHPYQQRLPRSHFEYKVALITDLKPFLSSSSANASSRASFLIFVVKLHYSKDYALKCPAIIIRPRPLTSQVRALRIYSYSASVALGGTKQLYIFWKACCPQAQSTAWFLSPFQH